MPMVKKVIHFPSGELDFQLFHHEDLKGGFQSVLLHCRSTFKKDWNSYSNISENLNAIAMVFERLKGECDEDETKSSG